MMDVHVLSKLVPKLISGFTSTGSLGSVGSVGSVGSAVIFVRCIIMVASGLPTRDIQLNS